MSAAPQAAEAVLSHRPAARLLPVRQGATQEPRRGAAGGGESGAAGRLGASPLGFIIPVTRCSHPSPKTEMLWGRRQREGGCGCCHLPFLSHGAMSIRTPVRWPSQAMLTVT